MTGDIVLNYQIHFFEKSLLRITNVQTFTLAVNEMQMGSQVLMCSLQADCLCSVLLQYQSVLELIKNICVSYYFVAISPSVIL